jgi:hypothetical protein
MAHFARVINNLVVEVIVAEQNYIDSLEIKPWETWVQTSYNTRGGKHYNPETGEVDKKKPLRKNYAGIGFRYDPERDAFIPPTPYPSWILNEETCLWESPVPYPDDNKMYIWNEQEQEWTPSGYMIENGEVIKDEVN